MTRLFWLQAWPKGKIATRSFSSVEEKEGKSSKKRLKTVPLSIRLKRGKRCRYIPHPRKYNATFLNLKSTFFCKNLIRTYVVQNSNTIQGHIETLRIFIELRRCIYRYTVVIIICRSSCWNCFHWFRNNGTKYSFLWTITYPAL